MVHRIDNPRSRAPSSVPPASAPAPGPPEREYPDNLDAGLLKIAGVCVLDAVLAILDTTPGLPVEQHACDPFDRVHRIRSGLSIDRLIEPQRRKAVHQ